MAPNGKRARRIETINLLATQIQAMEEFGTTECQPTLYDRRKAHLRRLYIRQSAILIRYRAIYNVPR